MKKTILIFALISLVFACKKEETTTTVDPRDKFVGTWKGTSRLIIPSGNIDETTSSAAFVKKGTASDELIFSNGSSELKVYMEDATTYRFSFSSTGVTSNGTKYIEDQEGKGSINSSGMTISELGTVKYYVSTNIVTGTVQSTYYKQ